MFHLLLPFLCGVSSLKGKIDPSSDGLSPGGGGGLIYETDGDARRLA